VVTARPLPKAPRALAVALGVGLDAVAGEPRWEPHPVAAFGSAMAAVEDALWADRRGRGVAHALAGVALGAGAGALLRSTCAATWLSVAGRGLAEAALAVARPLDAGDLPAARQAVRALVGRDPTTLDEADLVRAVVESVAENTVDAVVAPVLWALVGGAPATLGYRAVNTLDAMVGHRTVRHERYGWASARLDDVANWLPARATAALVAAVRPGAAVAVWRAVRDDAPAHPSPNAGVAEAAFAAALGVRLGGVNRYETVVEDRGRLGTGPPPARADIGRAVRLSRDVTAALVALALAADRGGGARCAR
jgi:adenosylcobinamide-phosphate synthase